MPLIVSGLVNFTVYIFTSVDVYTVLAKALDVDLGAVCLLFIA